jgi:hypothetical protein
MGFERSKDFSAVRICQVYLPEAFSPRAEKSNIYIPEVPIPVDRIVDRIRVSTLKPLVAGGHECNGDITTVASNDLRY